MRQRNVSCIERPRLPCLGGMVLSASWPVRPPVRAGLRQSIRSIDVTAALLALLLAAFVVVGASFQATNSTAWFASSPGAAAGSALAAVAITVVLYIPISLAYAWLD